MNLDWTTNPLAAGLECYRNQQFWHAHEHWEAVWLQSDEPNKTFIQALIQITAAFHHVQRQNLIGAASLLRAALRRLEPYPPEYGGIAVGPLRSSVRVWLLALENGTIAGIAFPEIPFAEE